MSENVERLLTIKQACEYLQVSKHTLWRLIRSTDPKKHIRAFGFGEKTTRIPQSELVRLLERSEIQPVEPEANE
jgi:excisionase family DNA binding protein